MPLSGNRSMKYKSYFSAYVISDCMPILDLISVYIVILHDAGNPGRSPGG